MTAAVAATSTPRGDRTGVIALIVAEAISTLGTRISLLALPWLILVTSHDPVRVGIVAGASTLPYVLNGFIASPLVDRIGARRMSIISDLVSAVGMALVALFYDAGIVEIALIVAVTGSFRGVGDRAKNTMLKPLMDVSRIDPVRVTSAYQGATQLASLSGGSVAGVLIALYNPWGVIWIDVVSYLVCAAMVAALVIMPDDGKKKEKPELQVVDGVYVSNLAKTSLEPEPPREPYLKQLGAAFTFLAHDRLISAMVGMLFITNLFVQVGTVTFIPLWINSRLDHSPVALGWISGAFALGTIAGNAVFTAYATKLPRYATFVAGYLLGGMPRFLIFALTDNLAVVTAVWAFAGFAMSSTNPTIGAIMYQRVPVNMLARVGSLTSALAFLGFSVGGVVGGLAVEHMGFTPAVVFASVIYFMATLIPIFGYPTWSLMDKIAKPAKKLATSAKVAIRLVLAEGRWTVSARRVDGATVVRPQPVGLDRVTQALWLINPPELQPTVRAMLTYEQADAQAREEELRAQLAVAEKRLAAARATAAATGHRVPSGVAAVPGALGLTAGGDGPPDGDPGATEAGAPGPRTRSGRAGRGSEPGTGSPRSRSGRVGHGSGTDTGSPGSRPGGAGRGSRTDSGTADAGPGGRSGNAGRGPKPAGADRHGSGPDGGPGPDEPGTAGAEPDEGPGPAGTGTAGTTPDPDRADTGESLIEEILDAAAEVAGIGSGTAETAGAPAVGIARPRDPDDGLGTHSNGHHNGHASLDDAVEFSLTRPEDDIRRTQ